MASHSKILDDIVKSIDADIASFQGKMPDMEGKIYSKILELAKDLEVKNGRITNSVQNIRAIGKLMQEIQKVMLSPEYVDRVENFTKAFDQVEKLQASYFSALAVDIKPKKLLGAIKMDAIGYTIDQLTEAGISAKVSPGIEQILRNNVTQGGSFSDLMEQMRSYITTTTDADGNKSLGALERHTSQITTDALNQYSASYNETVSSDLGFKWRMYTGSLLETSRPWCVHMIKKKYVHESELETVISDNIDGVQICSGEIPCNKKTGLPSGMMKGTNASNVAQRRGGWQCGHQFGGVPDAVVPKGLRDKHLNS